MRYERHTKDVDGVIKVEVLTERKVDDLRFNERINEMASDALKEIDSAVKSARRRIEPERFDASMSELLGRGVNDSIWMENQQAMARFQQRGLMGLQQNANRIFGLGGF